MEKKHYFIGVSLGASANEKTGMVVIERSERDGKYFHSVVKTDRFPLGSTFEAIAERVSGSRQRLKGEGHSCEVILDRTAVGEPIVDLFREVVREISQELFLIKGLTAHRDEKQWSRQYLPKTDIIGSLQLVYQSHRFDIAAGLKEAETMARQAESFMTTARAKAGSDNDPAEREGADDDILIAWAIATWAAENPPPVPRCRQL